MGAFSVAKSCGLACAALVLTPAADPAATTLPSHAPWDQKDTIIVLDPYEENAINYDRLKQDPHRVLAVIHQASKIKFNKVTKSRDDHCDVKFQDQAVLARRYGIFFGAYHFGTDDDPIRQAQLFLRCINGSGVRLVALDLEGPSSPSMSIEQAKSFLDYFEQNDPEHRTLAIYAPRSVAKTISEQFDRHSLFARGVLWIASPTLDWPPTKAGQPLPPIGTTVWGDYSIWQFTSDIMCMKSRRAKEERRRVAIVQGDPTAHFSTIRPCPIRIRGIDEGTDVNVFNGSEAELRALFMR